MDFQEAEKLVRDTAVSTIEKSRGAMKFSERKFEDFLRLLTSEKMADDEKIEKARQDCIDSFAAMLDSKIEGCKKMDELSRTIVGKVKW